MKHLARDFGKVPASGEIGAQRVKLLSQFIVRGRGDDSCGKGEKQRGGEQWFHGVSSRDFGWPSASTSRVMRETVSGES